MSDPRDSNTPINVHKSPRFASEFASVAELTHLLASSSSTSTYTYLNLNFLTSLYTHPKKTHKQSSKCLVNNAVPLPPLRVALPDALPPLLLDPRLLPRSSSRSLTRLPLNPHRPSRLLPCSSRAPALDCSARWPQPQRKFQTRLCASFPDKNPALGSTFPEVVLTVVSIQWCCCRLFHRARHRWLLQRWL